MKPAVIVLTFNSACTLPATLRQAVRVSDEVFVVDSYSSDETIALAESCGAKVVQHEFENYGAQRNWAIDNLHVTAQWQLHLDADEWMEDELVKTIANLPDTPPFNGYFLPRYVRFLGRTLRHGGMNPTWHMRLFRTGAGRCEERKYDQHFILLDGASAKLSGAMIDDIRMPIAEWTARHNRWSDAEVSELESANQPGRLVPNATGNPIERKRYLRKQYDKMPLFVRPFLLFFYRYFVRCGFLDGKEGFIFWVLQTFWFRFLIDAKIWEQRQRKKLNISND